MCERDLPGEREPDARAAGLGCEEGYKYLLEKVVFDPDAVVADLQEERIGIVKPDQPHTALQAPHRLRRRVNIDQVLQIGFA